MTTGATETTFEPGRHRRARAGGGHARACLRKVPRAHDVEARLLRALRPTRSCEQAKQFDAVSFGWSHMTYSAEEGAKLSTVKDDSSGFYIPAGYADVVPTLREAGVELKLNVFMANAPLRTMLADESSARRRSRRSWRSLSACTPTSATIPTVA